MTSLMTVLQMKPYHLDQRGIKVFDEKTAMKAMVDYAKIKCAEQRELCFQNSEARHHPDEDPEVIRESIINAEEPKFI